MTKFFVSGTPVPKQSFRYAKGGGYTDPRVTNWQAEIGNKACTYLPVYKGNVRVRLEFALPDERRRDLDNLSKAVLDALNLIAYVDDKQVTDLHVTKVVDRANPGVWIEIEEA